MIYELRTYIIVPGRIQDIKARFRDHTIGLFEKHGMQVVGFWQTVESEEPADELVYLLAFEDMKARNAAFDAFRNDPEWQAVYKASRINGPLVARVTSKFLQPTDFSALK